MRFLLGLIEIIDRHVLTVDVTELYRVLLLLLLLLLAIQMGDCVTEFYRVFQRERERERRLGKEREGGRRRCGEAVVTDFPFHRFAFVSLSPFLTEFVSYPSPTGFDWVLPGFTEFSLVLPHFIGFYWVLLGFTRFC